MENIIGHIPMPTIAEPSLYEVSNKLDTFLDEVDNYIKTDSDGKKKFFSKDYIEDFIKSVKSSAPAFPLRAVRTTGALFTVEAMTSKATEEVWKNVADQLKRRQLERINFLNLQIAY